MHLSDTIDFSTKNELSFVDTLVKLTNYEIDIREQTMINSMVKVGAFPHRKEINEFDFDFQPTVNKQQILDFISLRFIEDKKKYSIYG